MSNQPSPEQIAEQKTLFGHPTGLYMLFFAEMWERFSYYGMRALLVLYIIKGFLQKGDGEAYAIYGAYTSLVYATPFIGGMIADKLLGARRAVILGGLLMAAGHLVMTIESEQPFFIALALLIVGNGFFKPNISTIVGSLYPDGSPQRDAGFTIFYIGINLGAAMAPLLCGYVGEKYGWHYGFGLATIGMLVGLAVFVSFRGDHPRLDPRCSSDQWVDDDLPQLERSHLRTRPQCSRCNLFDFLRSHCFRGTRQISSTFLGG